VKLLQKNGLPCKKLLAMTKKAWYKKITIATYKATRNGRKHCKKWIATQKDTRNDEKALHKWIATQKAARNDEKALHKEVATQKVARNDEKALTIKKEPHTRCKALRNSVAMINRLSMVLMLLKSQ
jgi:hypothetical protein